MKTLDELKADITKILSAINKNKQTNLMFKKVEDASFSFHFNQGNGIVVTIFDWKYFNDMCSKNVNPDKAMEAAYLQIEIREEVYEDGIYADSTFFGIKLKYPRENCYDRIDGAQSTSAVNFPNIGDNSEFKLATTIYAAYKYFKQIIAPQGW